MTLLAMRNKKGYTLVEMIVVVIIIAILMTVGIRRLSNNNIHTYNAEVCVNKIYSDIASFVHTASTSKIITGDTVPQEYIISFIDDEKNNDWREGMSNSEILATGIQLLYKHNDELKEVKEIAFHKDSKCSNTKYIMLADVNFTTGTMLPGLISIGNQSGFKLTTRERKIYDSTLNQTINTGATTRFTGDIEFMQCFRETSPDAPGEWQGTVYNTNCYRFARILFDTRTGIIKKSFCKYRADYVQRCKERTADF